MADSGPATVTSMLKGTVELARTTYAKCRDCPGKYESLKSDTRQLGNVLEDLEGLAKQQNLTETRQQEVFQQTATCHELLSVLEREVDSFRSLGASDRRASDRVRWDDERVKELKDHLTNVLAMVTTLYQRMVATSQPKVEAALMQLIEEIHSGQRPPTSLTSLPPTPHTQADQAAWPGIVNDLTSVGVPPEAAEEHRIWIIQWLRDAKPEVQSPPGSETGASSNSNPLSFHDQHRANSSSTSRDLHPTVSSSGELRYMDAFGDFGTETAADVKRSPNTFKEDVNRSREYWVRGNWAEVKRNLLRVMIAAQLPQHRRADIDAKTAAFLLGVACSNSGDFEAAKVVFHSILEPFPRSGSVDDVPPYSDAQIAAATWLGDMCLKTNRVEDAALAWCIALDALRRRDQERARSRIRTNSLPQQTPMTPPTSPPQQQTAARSRFSMRHPSLDIAPPPAPGSGAIPPAMVGPSAHARMILSELVFVNRGTGNLHSLLEGLESGWYPQMTDAQGSVFTETTLLAPEQMRTIVVHALQASEHADDRTALMSLYKTQSADAISQMVLCKRENIIRQYASQSQIEEKILPDELLRSPTRRGVWPMMYDDQFSYLAAITALEYIHEHTSLKEEGVSFNIPILDKKQSEQLVRERGKPIYMAKDLQPKERKDVERFIEAVRSTLSSMNFHVREAPAEFRCQPRTDFPHPRWASVASLSVRVVGFHPGGFMAKLKLACYVSDIVHWDGRHDAQDTSDRDSSELVKEMYYSLAIRHEAERGNVLPGSGPRGAGPDAVSVGGM